MKFEEKLIILRKKKLLSQEQLAEKLEVTRQTVSKWELGQSKPDMDKLTAISKLFNESIDTLTNDEILLDENKLKVEEKKEAFINNGNKKDRKIVVYILIIILIASTATLAYRIANGIKVKKDAIVENIKKQMDNQKSTFDSISDSIKEKYDEMDNQKSASDSIKEKYNEMNNQFDIDSFNRTFENYQGTNNKIIVGLELDGIIKNNKKNSNHLIEVIFDSTSYGTDANNIKNIKTQLKDFSGTGSRQEYEISLDYNEEGYVNKVTIETL